MAARLGGLVGSALASAKGQWPLACWAASMTLLNVVLIFAALAGRSSTRSPSSCADLTRPTYFSPDPTDKMCMQSAFELEGESSAWYFMKAAPPPAQCKVQGFTIEELEPQFNFRRAWALGYAGSPEDKSQLQMYLRPIQDRAMATRKRRVLVTMGAQKWENIAWFLKQYPLDFSEIHAFEERPATLRKPPNSGFTFPDLIDSMNSQSQVKGAGSLPVPDWALDRIKLYHGLVRNVDAEPGESGTTRTYNITKVLLRNLKLTEEDTVVVLMDIEHAEWDVLPVWMEIPDMPRIIDELFLEAHYQHPSMANFHWDKGHTRDEAYRLYLQLRFKGFFVHAWP